MPPRFAGEPPIAVRLSDKSAHYQQGNHPSISVGVVAGSIRVRLSSLVESVALCVFHIFCTWEKVSSQSGLPEVLNRRISPRRGNIQSARVCVSLYLFISNILQKQHIKELLSFYSAGAFLKGKTPRFFLFNSAQRYYLYLWFTNK